MELFEELSEEALENLQRLEELRKTVLLIRQ